MGRLNGKVAIITGGSQGIGLRTVEMFVGEGARVVIADLLAEQGETAASRIGADCTFMRTDVTSEADIKSLIAFTVERFGDVDILFNNAGMIGQPGGIEAVNVEKFDQVMASHVRGVMLGMKHVAPLMRERRQGSIINTGSISGIQSVSAYLDYSAAKAAVIHLTKCVAMELGEHGIRVNSISPGQIATGMGRSGADAERKAAFMREYNKTQQPIPRSGLPDDIANAAVFLASDEASFVNGHDLVVDGGLIGGISWSARKKNGAEMQAALEAYSG